MFNTGKDREDKLLLLLCASRRFWRPQFSWGYWGKKTVRGIFKEKHEKGINMGKNSSLLSTDLTQPRACSGKVTLCEFGRRECVSEQYIILGFPNLNRSLSS